MAESNMQTLIRVLLTPAPGIESTAQQVLTERTVDTAVGAQLDTIGFIVGRERQGIADDEIYRRYIRAQITANKSDGLVEDLITIAALVVDEEDATITVVRVAGVGTTVLRVEGVALATEVAAVLIEILKRSVSAGVRIILEYSTQDPETVLYWTTQGVWGTAVWGRATSEEI